MNKSFKLVTPYCNVEVVLEEKDANMVEEVEEWICKSCGVPSDRQVEEAMKRFKRKLEEIRENIQK